MHLPDLLDLFSFSEVEIGLLSGLTLFFVGQLVYYFHYLGKPSRRTNAIKKGRYILPTVTLPVSVIICAKNESANLAQFLPSVLEQNYPQYEVIVVNEGSSDESEEVLERLKTKYSHLYHTYIPQGSKNLSKKKLAVALGIKASKYDILLFTEADCKPLSSEWISSMVRHFEERVDIVVGYGAFPKSTGLITKLAVFDTLVNGLQYMSSALNRKAYMGVNRNLAYRKEAFFKGNGFQTYLQLHSGEDDLFVNENSTRQNTQVEVSDESITEMGYCDFYTWREMKIRHLATSQYYKPQPFSFRKTAKFSRFFFWAFAIATLVYGGLSFGQISSIVLLSSAGVAILFRWFSLGLVLNKAARTLQKDEKFYWSIPILDIIQPCYNVYFKVYHLFRGKSDFIWRV